jgi:hypothetical protein
MFDDKPKSHGLITRFKAGNDAGLSTRFPAGVSGNQSGLSRLQIEYNRYRDKLFDPEMRDAAFATLKKAVQKGEQWATLKYLDLVGQAFPKAPIDVNLSGGIQIQEGDLQDALAFIERELVSYASGRGATADTVEASSDAASATPVRVAGILGATEPDPTGE